jgi:hypothetical protein
VIAGLDERHGRLVLPGAGQPSERDQWMGVCHSCSNACTFRP